MSKDNPPQTKPYEFGLVYSKEYGGYVSTGSHENVGNILVVEKSALLAAQKVSEEFQKKFVQYFDANQKLTAQLESLRTAIFRYREEPNFTDDMLYAALEEKK